MSNPILAIFLLILIGAAVHSYGKPRIGFKKKGFFPVLSLYSRDLTQMAREGRLDPVVGREKEIRRVIQALSRRTKNNPVLVGPSGVGKTAIVEGLAQAIVNGKVPSSLLEKKVLALDLSGLIAGTKFRGEFEQRLKKITDEIISSQRMIILFIDEIHALAEAGEATGALDADDILKPPLARGDLQVVGATTPLEYDKYIRQDATLDRRLQVIPIGEPSAEETIKILWGIKGKYESHHGVKITEEAIHEAVKLTGKHIKNRFYPDKAIDLLDETCAKVRLDAVVGKEGKKTALVVRVKDIREVAEEWKK